MVDRAALEMPCPSPGPGFESRTLRQKVCDPMSTGFFLWNQMELARVFVKNIEEMPILQKNNIEETYKQ